MYKKIRKIILNYLPILTKVKLLYNMPYLYYLLEINPSSCTIMVTNRCNLKCIMCKQWQEPIGKELSTNDWKKIIIDLKRNRIRSIHFSGGEPLLREDLVELVSFCAAEKFAVGITTNGSLLNSYILQKLTCAGLRSLALSIDALNGEYEKIRGGLVNSFKLVEESAHLIAELRMKKRIDAYINFTLMRSNIKALKAVKAFADKNKLPLAICLLDKNSFLFNLERNKNEFWINSKEDFEDLRDAINFLRSENMKAPKSLIINFPAIDFIGDYFKDPRQGQIFCISSQDRIIIDSYGNLLGGCMSMGNFGNIRDANFSVLKKQERYKIAKKNMFFKKCKGCSCGYLFNIRCTPGLMARHLLTKARHLV